MAKPRVPTDPSMSTEVRSFLEDLQSKADEVDDVTPESIGAQEADPQLSSVILPVIHNADYTTVLTDGEKNMVMIAPATALTIAAEASVDYPLGTCITIMNFTGGNISVSVAGGNTMYLAGTGATGTRTLADFGVATAVKITSVASAGVVQWMISGTALT